MSRMRMWSVGVVAAALLVAGASGGQDAIDESPGNELNSADVDRPVDGDSRLRTKSPTGADADIPLGADVPADGQPPLPPAPTTANGSGDSLQPEDGASANSSARGSGGSSRNRAAFGVTFRSHNSQALTVGSIVPDSPAADIGLEPGDQIVSVDGHSYFDANAFVAAAGEFRVGDEVEVVYWRNGSEYSAIAQLAAWDSVFGPATLEQHRVLRPSFDDDGEAIRESTHSFETTPASSYCPESMSGASFGYGYGYDYGSYQWNRMVDDDCDD